MAVQGGFLFSKLINVHALLFSTLEDVYFLIFQMPLISFNLRNLLLTTAVIATLLLLFVTIGPQGVSPVSAMSEKLEAKSFKNLNLKASVLPVSSFKGGDVAPGVSIKSDNVNVLVSEFYLNSIFE